MRSLAHVLVVAAPLCLASCTDEPTATTGDEGVVCGATSSLALATCVEQSRYEEDLAFVAAERDPGSAHHLAVQNLCADRFAELGYEVERHNYGTGVNVIGVLPGASEERVVISAHYDHIEGCVGADDNATGVAGLLETARVLSTGSFDRTLVVACWDEEELGLVGADAYAQRAVDTDEPLAAVFVYEMLGYADSAPNTQELPLGFEAVFPDAVAKVSENDFAADFIAAIGDDMIQPSLDAMETNADQLGVRALTLTVEAAYKNDPGFRDLQRSDHAPFWQRDIPALFVTDTSEFRYAAYHCRNGLVDEIANLDPAFATGAVRMTTAALADLLGVR